MCVLRLPPVENSCTIWCITVLSATVEAAKHKKKGHFGDIGHTWQGVTLDVWGCAGLLHQFSSSRKQRHICLYINWMTVDTMEIGGEKRTNLYLPEQEMSHLSDDTKCQQLPPKMTSDSAACRQRINQIHINSDEMRRRQARYQGLAVRRLEARACKTRSVTYSGGGKRSFWTPCALLMDWNVLKVRCKAPNQVNFSAVANIYPTCCTCTSVSSSELDASARCTSRVQELQESNN